MLKYCRVVDTPEKETVSPVTDVPDERDTLLTRWILYALFIAAAYISVSYAFHLMLGESMAESRIMIHNKVINGTAPKPVQYRILTYYIVEGIHRLSNISIWRLDLILRFVFTTLSLAYLFKFFRRWFGFAASAAGALILPAVLPVTYIDYIHQPHDIPNLFFTILALQFIRDRREGWLILLIPFAMLNRESFLIVIWMWIFYNFDRLPLKLLVTQFVLFVMIGIVIYLALPYYFGPRENYVEMLQLANNLKSGMFIKWFSRLLAFMGPLLIAAFIRLRSKPLFLKRSLGYVAIFMVVNFLFGMYQETRLFLPVLPVVIPLGLAAIFPAYDPDKQVSK